MLGHQARMKNSRRHLTLVSAAVLLLASCGREAPPPEAARTALPADALAVVEGRPIRLEEFTAEMERRARGRSGAFARPEDREALLEELVRTEALYLRALDAGLDRRPDIARQIRRFLAERYREENFPDAEEQPFVTDAELAAAYAAHRDRFTMPAEIRLAVIRLGFPARADEDRKAAVRERADAVLAEARATAASETSFSELARRHSEDQATRYRGGDAGWLAQGTTGDWPAEVLSAAWALETPGQFAPVVVTSNACHVVRLTGRRPPRLRPLEEAAEALRHELAVERRRAAEQEFHASLRAGLEVTVNRPLLESVTPPASTAVAAAPPPLPAR